MEAPARHLRDAVAGCTFDDFLFRPQFSVLDRRDPAAIDLTCRFSQHLTLKRPLVSANMDTVTRAPMAIVQAEEGGSASSTVGSAAGTSSRRSVRFASSNAPSTA